MAGATVSPAMPMHIGHGLKDDIQGDERRMSTVPEPRTQTTPSTKLDGILEETARALNSGGKSKTPTAIAKPESFKTLAQHSAVPLTPAKAPAHVAEAVQPVEGEDKTESLEKRVEELESEVRALRQHTTTERDNAPKSKESSSDATEDDAAKDAGPAANDDLLTVKSDSDIDKAQKVELACYDAVTFRKQKKSLGVVEGPALAYISTTTPDRGIGQSSVGEDAGHGSYPSRLVINSYCLLARLEEITGLRIGKSNVFLRPFKYCVLFEDKIREDLAKLRISGARSTDEAIDHCSAAHSEGGAKKATVDTPDTTKGSSPVTEANSEAPAGEAEVDEDDPSKDRADNNSDADAVLLSHMELLVNFMDTQMRDIFQLRQEIEQGSLQEIAFEDLWHLFRPGELVLRGREDQKAGRRAYRVLHVTGGRSILDIHEKPVAETSLEPDGEFGPEDSISGNRKASRVSMTKSALKVDCCYCDYDGEWYGPKVSRFIMYEYYGKRKITSLDIYPGRFDDDWEGTKNVLLARGEKFVSCGGISHIAYAGRDLPDENVPADIEDVRCECIIDQKHMLGDDMSFHDRLLKEPSEVDVREFPDKFSGCSIPDCKVCIEYTDLYPDEQVDRQMRTDFMHTGLAEQLTAVTKSEPTQEQKMLLPLRLYGYALADRRWHALNIENVRGLNEENSMDGPLRSFEELVLPKGHKTLIQAVVQNQMRWVGGSEEGSQPDDGGPTMDVIRGKGRGLIILLHGFPGVT